MSTVGATSDFVLTRNDIIEMAFQEAGLLEVNRALDPARLAWGVKRLGIILKRLESEKKHIWAITPVPSTLALVANTFTYTSANGLPTNIKRLVSVNYRNSPGIDTPVRIVRTEDFALVSDKFQRGTPDHCFLTEHRDVGSQTMYVWPGLTAINTANVVTGTDALDYTCIRGHAAADVNRPITGADYLLYWEQTGSGGSAWVEGTAYVAAEHLRLWHERPLADFVSASDNPDMPQEWMEVLLYEMTQAALNPSGVNLDERVYFQKLREGSREAIHTQQTPKTTNKHNKAQYF